MALGEENITLLLIPCCHSWPESILLMIVFELTEPMDMLFLPSVLVKTGTSGSNGGQPRLTRCGSLSTSWFMLMKEGQWGYHVTGNRTSGIKAHR